MEEFENLELELSDVGWNLSSDKGDCSSSDGEQSNTESEPLFIPDCIGLNRDEWSKKEVIIVDASGTPVATAVVEFISEFSHPDGRAALGHSHVGVVVCETTGFDVRITPHSIQRWPIQQVLFDGVSLFHQEQKYLTKFAAGIALRGGCQGSRKYVSSRTRQPQSIAKKEKVICQNTLLAALRRPCCKRHCMRQSSATQLAVLRQEMYSGNFKSKNAMKLGVHRGFHYCPDSSQRLCVVEGKVVCLKAWQIIYEVSKSNFYYHAKSASSGRRAQNHGNAGKVRTSAHMLQARVTMDILLNAKVDQMPHRPHTLPSGEKVVQKVLPNGTKWKGILADVNAVQGNCGVKNISQSSCSKIRKKFFSDFQVKRRGDGFARCAKCDKLIKMQDVHPPGSAAYRRAHRKYVQHLKDQEAARAAYCRSKALSCSRPLQMLTIMHDKIDHSKTDSPCLAGRTKKCEGFAKLPVSVSGILAHGHGNGKYAHYVVDLYPADSNQTIGSIARLLRDLEMPPKSADPGSLFLGAGRSQLYRAILRGNEECVASLKRKPSSQKGFQPLPPILHVQLDNCWKDNKSRYIMCFWSMLVAKGVFDEIHVLYMVVGHTHVDIDASFGRWSMRLCENDYPTVPLFMKSYMNLEKEPVIPTLIEEVPDFKAFIADYISKDDLTGHSQRRQYLFYRREDGWPLMKYKMRCTDQTWLPDSGIELWERLPNGKPNLPSGIPDAVMPRLMKGHDDIVRGISGFIEHWQSVACTDPSGVRVVQYNRLIEYWSGVKDALAEKKIESVGKLVFGFWPRTRQPFESSSIDEEDAAEREEFAKDDHYIDPRSSRPLPSFRVGRDCFCGYFLLARPADDSPAPIWLGEAMSNPILAIGNEYYKQIRVQWYKPMRRRGFKSNPYNNWDTKENFKWEVDNTYPEQWLSTDSILTAWKSCRRPSAKTISAPKTQVGIAVENMLRSQQEQSSPHSTNMDFDSE